MEHCPQCDEDGEEWHPSKAGCLNCGYGVFECDYCDFRTPAKLEREAHIHRDWGGDIAETCPHIEKYEKAMEQAVEEHGPALGLFEEDD